MRATEIIEALLFASDAPLTAADLCRAHEDLDEDAVEEAIRALRAEYDATGRAFQIYEIAGGYQLLTRPEYASVLERFHTVPQSGRLSGAALEVLAIIAYRQPIGRAEIEEIRGIGSAGVLRTLQERQLIDVVGRGEGLGRPLLYGTTKKFLEHFGFNSLHDLPRPEELPVVLKQRTSGDGAAPQAQNGAAGPQPVAAARRAEAPPAEPAATAGAPPATDASAPGSDGAAPATAGAAPDLSAAGPSVLEARAADAASGPRAGTADGATAEGAAERAAAGAVPGPGDEDEPRPGVAAGPDHGHAASDGVGQVPAEGQPAAAEPGPTED